jgi:NTP pyrophosphatase (non-canonical NTP hydrolase)
MSTPTQQEIEAIWERHHIERIPRHDMSNECRLAAVIIALEKEQAAPKPDAESAAVKTTTDMDLLGFDAYQTFTQSTARYPGKGEASAEALAYTACGLAGEVGEALQPLIERLHKTLEVFEAPTNVDDAMGLEGDAGDPNSDRGRLRMLKRFLATLNDFDECARELELMKREFREGGAKLPPLVEVPAEYTARVMKELGDVAWYVATHAQENRLQFSWIVAENIRKLRDRAARNVLHGKGDDR